MRKVFGNASDFFDIKLYHIKEVIPQEFDWNELTAYLGPGKRIEPETRQKFEIQFIFKDSGEVLKRMEFQDFEEARLKYEQIIDELKNSEVMDFAERYGLSLED